MDQFFQSLFSPISNWLHSSSSASGFRSPTPSPTAMPTPIPTYGGYTEDQLKQGIAKAYGADNPLIPNLSTYLQAGQQLPKGEDPLLPIILALRETQGGRDLLNPAKVAKGGLGTNNVYNLRNNTGAFQNYPDLKTAVMGNYSSGGPSSGLVGLMNGVNDQNRGIYQDFRDNPTDLSKLFAHWSPPTDSNGLLPQQVSNYNWIRNNVLGLPQGQ